MYLELIKNIALLVAIIDFAIYVSYIWGKYGVQPSISASFYDLPERYNIYFRFYIFILSLAVITSGFGWKTPLFFISGTLLSMVGIFPDLFKNKTKHILHLIGAIGGITVAIIGLSTLNLTIGVIAATTIVSMSILFRILLGKEDILWWIEIISFSTIIFALLYLNNYFKII
jgi:hypothetical protein